MADLFIFIFYSKRENPNHLPHVDQKEVPFLKDKGWKKETFVAD